MSFMAIFVYKKKKADSFPNRFFSPPFSATTCDFFSSITASSDWSMQWGSVNFLPFVVPFLLRDFLEFLRLKKGLKRKIKLLLNLIGWSKVQNYEKEEAMWRRFGPPPQRHLFYSLPSVFIKSLKITSLLSSVQMLRPRWGPGQISWLHTYEDVLKIPCFISKKKNPMFNNPLILFK